MSNMHTLLNILLIFFDKHLGEAVLLVLFYSRLLMSFFYRSDHWHLVQSACLPSTANNVGCSPFQFHESSIYNPVNSFVWTRVTLQLPDHISSRYRILWQLLFLCNKHSICICMTVWKNSWDVNVVEF